jgi:hypothetical protein
LDTGDGEPPSAFNVVTLPAVRSAGACRIDLLIADLSFASWGRVHHQARNGQDSTPAQQKCKDEPKVNDGRKNLPIAAKTTTHGGSGS